MKMNKKIVIALAVLAAFMMLAVPFIPAQGTDADANNVNLSLIYSADFGSNYVVEYEATEDGGTFTMAGVAEKMIEADAKTIDSALPSYGAGTTAYVWGKLTGLPDSTTANPVTIKQTNAALKQLNSTAYPDGIREVTYGEATINDGYFFLVPVGLTDTSASKIVTIEVTVNSVKTTYSLDFTELKGYVWTTVDTVANIDYTSNDAYLYTGVETTIGSTITVPTGKYLVVGPNAKMQTAMADDSNHGLIDVIGTLINRGTIVSENGSQGGTVKSTGLFINYGNVSIINESDPYYAINVADGTFVMLGGEVTSRYGGLCSSGTSVLVLLGGSIAPTLNGGSSGNLAVSAGGSKIMISDDVQISNPNGTIASASVVQIREGCKLEMSGGSVTTTVGYGISIWGSGEIEMKGGIITAAAAGISTNGNNNDVNNVVISGGTINGGEAAVYQPYGSFTITGGTLTGDTAIYLKCTDLTISGGTITATGSQTAFKHSGNGFNSTGDAIVIENTIGYQDSPIVDIQTGTGKAAITSANAYEIAFYQFGTPDEDTEIKRLVLASGVDCKIAGVEGESSTASTSAVVFTGNSGTITNDGTITNNGTIAIGGIFTNTGTITNNGSVSFGTYTMTDMTEIKGQIAFDGVKTITAASGSEITWTSNETLTAGTDGTYEMNVDEMNTVIKTGTVTLNNGHLDEEGQTITVNEGAIFAITNGITLMNGTSIVNKGTTTINGTITCNGVELSDLSQVTGMVTLTGSGSIDAAAGSKITWTTGYIEAKTSSAWTAVWDSQKSAYAITITEGIVDMTAPVIVGQVLTVDSGAILNVPSSKSLTVYGVVVNNGTIDVSGTLVVDATAGAIVGTNGITGTSGTVNVYKDATLNPAAAGLVQGTINVFQGATLTGAIAPSNAMFVMTNTGSTEILGIVIDNKTVGDVRNVTYTLKGTATANVSIDYFLSNDKLVVDQGATLNVTALKIGDGVKFNVAGNVIGEAATIVLGTTGTMEIASTGNVAVQKIDMTASNSGVKAIMIKAGGVITALVDGSTSEKAKSMATLTNIAAGNGGLSIIKGSVYINGTLATPDDTGKITVAAGAGAVKISGNVEEGVTLVVEENASIVIPKDSTLTFEEGSKFNYDNAATITFEEKSSSIIYEKGSEVNDVVIKVETKEDSEGTTVAVRIYLVSENEKKLIISVDYVEVLPGKTYGDALNGVIVMPTKKTVTFDGWYNLAFNEKIRSTDIVGNNDVTLTACFSDEGRVPVQKEDTPSETIIIDGRTDSQSFAGSDFALPVAIICLIVAILALGFVVLKKR